MRNLALVEMASVAPMTQLNPLAMYENEAAKLIRMNRTGFRRLVESGHIPYTFHAGGKRRIYLYDDIRAYLNSRERFTIINGNPPRNFRKEMK